MNHLSCMKMLCAAVMFMTSANVFCQTGYKGFFRSDDLKASLMLNLENNDITIEDLGIDGTYGYMKGNLNATWVVLKVKKIDKKKAVVRMVSDNGNDGQDVELILTNNGDLILKLVGGEQNIKTVSNRKYVKLPKEVIFKKQK